MTERIRQACAKMFIFYLFTSARRLRFIDSSNFFTALCKKKVDSRRGVYYVALLLLINLFLSCPNYGLHANTFPISDANVSLQDIWEYHASTRGAKVGIALYIICEDRRILILRARACKNATMNFGVYTECFARCAFKKFKEYDSEVLRELFTKSFYTLSTSLSHLPETFLNYAELFCAIERIIFFILYARSLYLTFFFCQTSAIRVHEKFDECE